MWVGPFEQEGRGGTRAVTVVRFGAGAAVCGAARSGGCSQEAISCRLSTRLHASSRHLPAIPRSWADS